jgi:integrase
VLHTVALHLIFLCIIERTKTHKAVLSFIFVHGLIQVALTDTAIKNLKPKDKPYPKSDSNGLIIDVRPTGLKVWRYRFRFNDKAAIYTIGEYPIIGLADARAKRDEARKMIINGIDPREAKKETKAAIIQKQDEAKKAVYTFLDAFNDWHKFKATSWDANYADDVSARARMYLLPKLGSMALNTIKPADVLAVLKRCEESGKLDTLKKVRSILSQTSRFAVGMNRLDSDPTRDVPLDVFKKQEKNNHAHHTVPAEIRRIYQAVNKPYGGSFEIANAMKLLPLTALRANELCGLKWCEVDFDNNLLRIEAERMKMKKEHIVPLSTQAIKLLKHQQEHHLGGAFVFPRSRDTTRYIAIESLLKAMRIQGIGKDDFTNHGWRHSFSTTMHELGYTPPAIEAQLSHVLGGVAGVYNKSLHLEERTKMMQAWADWLEVTTE